MNQNPACLPFCDELTRALREGAQLVDVHSPSECADSILSGAVNLPLDQLDSAQEKLNLKNCCSSIADVVNAAR